MADTPGLILKTKRESKNLNIAQVAKATRIRAVYLQAMESDNFASLPSPVHARGFLRIYADFLGLVSDDLVNNLAPDYQFTNSEKINNPSKLDNSRELDSSILDTPNLKPIKKSGEISTKPSNLIDDLSTEDKNQYPSLPEQNSEQTLISHSQLNSNRIFLTIGNKLRIQREELGLSLNEVEKHSHVLKRYLEAIEAGQFENLPSSVQSRGMLTNYARFLEIDSEEILLLFADALQALRLEKQQIDDKGSDSTNKFQKNTSHLRRYISIDLLFGSGLIILLIVFAIWGTGKVIDLYNAPAAAGKSASISDIILTPIQTATSEDEEPLQPLSLVTNTPEVFTTQISDIPANVQGQVQVYVVVLQRTWLRISVDNKISLEGRVEPGNAYSFNGNSQVEVLTGNGAALQIIHNQVDLGVMGVFGEIVDNIYTPNSIIQPTATITPTPTITPVPSITPRRTNTLIP